MLKIPKNYSKFDSQIYYIAYNYSAPDKDGWYSLVGCSIYKSLEKAEKKCENEPNFKDKKNSGTLKELAKFLRGKLLKKEIKLSRFRKEEKELFNAYYNHFEAQALNEAHIRKVKNRNKNKREYEILVKKLELLLNDKEILLKNQKINTKKFKKLELEISSTEREIKNYSKEVE